MATKAELKSLQEQNISLAEQITERNQRILDLEANLELLRTDLDRTNSLNQHLAREINRLSRSDSLNSLMCLNLMTAISVLGANERSRINDDIWKVDNYSNYQAVSTEDSQKSDT